MRPTIISLLQRLNPAPVVHAHCDGPCGVYDPSQARVSAEAVMTITKKLLDLKMPEPNDAGAMLQYQSTLARYVSIKEQQAHETKTHLLVLWTDYFKPEHVQKYPELHELFWKAAKACSAAKQSVSVEHAQELLDYVQQIHKIFWETKGRDVPWVTAAV